MASSQAHAKQQERRFGWKSYAFAALVAGIAAAKFRKQLKRPKVSQSQNEARWYSPSESDLRQEQLDELEQKERLARIKGAYDSLKSNYRNMRTASRYQKWEENPQQEGDPGENFKENANHGLEKSQLAERSKLRHHYVVLGLNPFRDEAFSQEEIKAAFRERALQFHPDKNPDNREEMRTKFRELMDSYRAIKSEKKIS